VTECCTSIDLALREHAKISWSLLKAAEIDGLHSKRGYETSEGTTCRTEGTLPGSANPHPKPGMHFSEGVTSINHRLTGLLWIWQTAVQWQFRGEVIACFLLKLQGSHTNEKRGHGQQVDFIIHGIGDKHMDSKVIS
jgi:hypothetical protein